MKILIVEDNQRLAHNISRGLMLSNENNEIDIAYSGENALLKISEHKPDVIILDWMLPNMSGIEVLQHIRQNNIYIPVLMLSAKSTIDNKIKGLEVGADDYLTKPFDLQELIARVSALKRRQRNIKQIILSASNLTLNTQTKEVLRGKQIINLTQKEFELLEFLLENKGIIQSVDQILYHVWDFASDTFAENTNNKVSVYIRYLRNKIDTPFPKSKAILETKRGYGYKILDI